MRKISSTLSNKHQIYHLDLKPENIVLSHKGQNIKLIDFGLSTTDSFERISSGTKQYASPEQITEPLKQGPKSDMYSLGLVILELFTDNIKEELINTLNSPYKTIVKDCLSKLTSNFSSICSKVEKVILLIVDNSLLFVLDICK